MKKLLTAIALLATAAPASANLLIYEGFDYTVGDRVIGQTNPYGTSWSDPALPNQPGPGAPAGFSQIDPQIIVAGNVAYPGTPPPTGDHFIVPRGVINAGANLTTQSNVARFLIPGAPHTAATVGDGTTGSLFFSISMQLTDFAAAAAGTGTGQAGNAAQQNGGFVAGFHWTDPSNDLHFGSGTTAAAYGGVVRIRREVAGDGITGTGNYEIGIAKNWNVGAANFVWDTAGAFAPDETVYLVGEYQFVGAPTVGTDDVFRLWINPTPGAPMPAPSLVATVGPDVNSGDFNAIRSFFFRSEAVTPGDLQFDEVRIGTQYQDVVPIPEPAAWVLLSFGMMVLGRRLPRR